MKKLIALFSVFISIHAAAQICYPGRFSAGPCFDSTEITRDTTLIFAVSKNYFTGTTVQLKMDVFYPDPALDTMTDRPFILLIHGGAFVTGNRNDMNYQCMEYARRGFVAATIDYRLGWNCAAQDFLQVCTLCQSQNYDLMTATYEAAQDARAALRFISANATMWDADPNKIFVGGTSAGSITAYHAVFWDQAEANAFCPWAVSQVGLLDTAGNSYPNTWSVKGLIDNCGAISKDSALLNNGNIPVISFHDEYDCAVPYGYGQVLSCFCSSFWSSAGSQVTHTLLTNNGICSEQNTILANGGHCTYPLPALIKRSSCFMKRILCNICLTQVNSNLAAIDSCESFPLGYTEFGMSPLAISVSPNPANDECTFRFSEPSRNSGVLRIYDAHGKLILAQPYLPLTTEVRLQTSAFAEGIYFAEAEIAGQVVKSRFAVAR